MAKRKKTAKRTKRKTNARKGPTLKSLSHRLHKIERRVFKKKYAAKAAESELAAKYG